MGFAIAVDEHVKVEHLFRIIQLAQGAAIIDHGLDTAFMAGADNIHNIGDALGRLERFAFDDIENGLHIISKMSQGGSGAQ